MAAATTPTTSNNTIKIDPQIERLRRQKLEKLLRRAIPLLLTLPYFIGLLWTFLHPVLSIVTGELKCRGSYIDENGLDVHRHAVDSYPLRRRSLNSSPSSTAVDVGLCDAVYSERVPISYAAVECFRHEAREDVVLDIVRIMPSMGPMIDSTEAIVIVVGENQQQSRTYECLVEQNEKGWYDSSDLNASVLHMIQRLGSRKDAPWLTKIVYIVSPTRMDASSSSCQPQKKLTTVVDTFITSYSGDEDALSKQHVNPLPPKYSSPMIRSLLVLSDVKTEQQVSQQDNTQVRILPQGTGGALPNLDLVFATFYSLQVHPANGFQDQSQSIYYGNSDVRVHPFGQEMENRVKDVVSRLGNMIGLDKSTLVSLESYASDLAGLLGFVAALVIGPVQPHSYALKHGIDALTIEVDVPAAAVTTSVGATAIHPHYADLSRCVEHLVRSISNLHERLHHSVAQYTMPSPSKFVSHGEYIYPAILVSLPLVVRALSLALRDITSFQFVFVGIVVGTVALTSFVNAFIAFMTGRSFLGVLVAIVALVSCRCIPQPCNEKEAGIDMDTTNECRRSLRFAICVLCIYLHAPLLLSNYSLGYPSAAFWTPLLAILVLPKRLSSTLSKSVVLKATMAIVKMLSLIAISPTTILPSDVPPQYTLIVYTPLYLLLVALWFV